ncbi:MAG: hypothetical protein ACKVS5_10570 [Parvularculaceae bacterium]
MRTISKIALPALLALAAAASAGAAEPAPSPPYEPMAKFAPFAGKTFRGEWSDENGAYVDIAKYELILNGRALQSTHRLEGGGYGGRTIFFFDEGAKNYVYHYFTTGGFHTQGTAAFVDGALVTEETVAGHATIASVKSRSVMSPDSIAIAVVYVGKDGSVTPGGNRVYRPVADPGRLFPDTQ